MKRFIIFTFIFTVFSINAFAEEAEVPEFKFINHGIIFYENLSGADKSFIDYFKENKGNVNKAMNNLLSEKYSASSG